MSETRLRFPSRITRKQALSFADEWLADSHKNGALFDAYAVSGVVAWPDPDKDNTPAQERYSEIADEILENACAVIREAVADAFLAAAREVIERERRSRRRLAKG